MKILTIAAIAATALSAVHAQSCVDACPEVYEPVCGSDGLTYENECFFNYKKCSTEDDKLTIAAKGECGAAGSSGSSGECPKGCPKIWDPVCGSDGKTYSSECDLKIVSCEFKNVTLASDGECASASGSGSVTCKQTFCQEIYKPVCGSDGKTYANECEFNNSKCEKPTLAIASDGECAGDSSESESGSGSNISTETPVPAPSGASIATQLTATLCVVATVASFVF